jgi:hypothetical protein
MPVDPLLNVYSGEDALLDYYMPDQGPPVPVRKSSSAEIATNRLLQLVELPKKLNPLQDGVSRSTISIALKLTLDQMVLEYMPN